MCSHKTTGHLSISITISIIYRNLVPLHEVRISRSLWKKLVGFIFPDERNVFMSISETLYKKLWANRPICMDQKPRVLSDYELKRETYFWYNMWLGTCTLYFRDIFLNSKLLYIEVPNNGLLHHIYRSVEYIRRGYLFGSWKRCTETYIHIELNI